MEAAEQIIYYAMALTAGLSLGLGIGDFFVAKAGDQFLGLTIAGRITNGLAVVLTIIYALLWVL